MNNKISRKKNSTLPKEVFGVDNKWKYDINQQ